MTEGTQEPNAEEKGYTVPDQEPEKGTDAPSKDTFESGMIPVSEPVPQATIDAQATVKAGEASVAKGISKVTDDRVLEALAKEGMTVEDVKALLADAVTANKAEIEALRQELQTVKQAGTDGMLKDDASVGGYPWMYWRLPSKGRFAESGRAGWIQTGPGGATPSGARDGSFSLYLHKGMTPVTKWGYIDPPTKPQAYLDSYLTILKAGGAVEFPASQVIAYNWHVSPPIKGLKFPQYEALKGSIKTYTCEACGEIRAFMPDDTGISAAYRTHLMTDHKYPFREAATALKDQGFTISPFKQATVEEMIERSSPTD